MQPETVFLMIAAVSIVALMCHRTPTGATNATPKRVMRHINKRRRFMGQPALYLGDPVLPDDWECNATRVQDWRAKRWP